MDVTPQLPPGGQLIQAYGDGGFRIGGQRHQGSVLVFPQRSVAWAVTGMADLDGGSVSAVLAETPHVEILLLGCGPRIAPPPPEFRRALREAGIALELLDTGAACRTFNVLLGEARRVAAALIAV
ncbi:MAG: Mth938-like domain-containing protein [Alphaproteobacteria bacterium]|nr:Mth938-like domain-containing protein [Alphaproteobacteria bacterium]